MISSIVLFFRRDWLEGAGPVVEAPSAPVAAVVDASVEAVIVAGAVAEVVAAELGVTVDVPKVGKKLVADVVAG